jgi:hypothetical protein
LFPSSSLEFMLGVFGLVRSNRACAGRRQIMTAHHLPL